MHDEIIGYMREHPDGVGSVEIAEHFLRFKNPPAQMAHAAVMAVLKNDRRCSYSGGVWRAMAETQPDSSPSLRSSAVAAVLVLGEGRRLRYVGVRTVFPETRMLFSVWFADHEKEQIAEPGLVEPDDRICPVAQQGLVLGEIAECLSETTPVFLNYRSQALLSWCCANAGETLNEKYLLMGHLVRMAAISGGRGTELADYYELLFGRRPAEMSAAAQTGLVVSCVTQLFEQLSYVGIESSSQFDREEDRELDQFDFSGKQFCATDLRALPESHGVYGFKNAGGEYIYIGKSVNLRRRMSGYFRSGEESPVKLEQLRAQSCSFTIHGCGSELESLLLEFRLITKYHPCLNAQIAIDERSGPRRKRDDCIVLLPHVQEGKALAVWLRGGQKIMLKTVSVQGETTGELARELGEFFFTEKTPVHGSDFAELEIATRWIQRHEEALLIVPVSRMASGDEVLKAMGSYLRDAAVD